jgi:DNA-binding winged helix-turn-helix (wHTH) protein
VCAATLDILTALVEHPGELVGNDELMARVWPGTLVEDGNLKLQVAVPRRMLGDGRGGRRRIAQTTGAGHRRCLNGGARAADTSTKNEQSSADFDLD